jgi:excisionase family DNA binding protein
LDGRVSDAESAWLTVRQAAEYLGWPVQRIYNKTRVGAIPHRKEGNRLMFSRAELEEWLDGFAHGPGARTFHSRSRALPARMDRRIA